MQLKEILEDLENLDESLSIYAKKNPEWSTDSEAFLVFGYDKIILGEFQYLLEIHIVKEVIDVWSKLHDGKAPSIEEVCEAVIYYAEYDAYLPVNR